MGKTKTKIMDNAEAEEVKSKSVQSKKGKTDYLVEKLKAELGEVEAKPKKKDVILEGAERPIESEPEKDSIASLQSDKEKKEVHHPKVGKEKPRSKKYKEAARLVDPEAHYPIPEAVELVKKTSYSRYDGTLEIHINSNIKNLRGSVSLPFAIAKKITILAFPSTGSTGSLQASSGQVDLGPDVIIGNDSTLEKIQKGKIDFDILITTPEWMPKLAVLAKVLGPKGLMPNPKQGTISDNLKKTVSELQTGKLDYKADKEGKAIHLSLGKVSQPSEELSQNVRVLLQSIGKSKISKAVLSPTLGPGIKLDISSI